MADSEANQSELGSRGGGIWLIVGVIVAGLLLVALSGFFLYTAKPRVDRSVTQRQLEQVQQQLNETRTRLGEATAGPPPSTGAPATSTGTNVTVALPRSITIEVPPSMIPPPPDPDPDPKIGTLTGAAVAILGAIATVLGSVAAVIRALRGKAG